jgi:hypothetical protein
VIVKRALTFVVPVLVVAALVSGCASTVPVHPKASKTPTSRATPSPIAASAPGSRVPVGCADLLGQAALQGLVGSTAKTDSDENTAPTNILSIAQRQYGTLYCDWDGVSTGSVSVPGSELQITVSPDAKAEFKSRFADIMADETAGDHPSATEGVAGDQSGYWCGTTLDAQGADGFLPICDAEMLVSDYWVSAQIGTVSGLSRSQLTSGLTTALKDIAATLKTAGPPPAQWVAPATTPPGFCSGAGSTATVRTIVGNPTLVASPIDDLRVNAAAVGLVGRDVRCVWASAGSAGISVELLAGGSWVFPDFAPKARGDSVIQGPYVPTTIPGTSSALLACDNDSCEAYLAIGTTVADIYTGAGLTRSSAELAALSTAIAAS